MEVKSLEWKDGAFVEPETGKRFLPVSGFMIVGEDLRDRFVEAAEPETVSAE